MVDTMSSFVNLQVPVFIDGPCNAWWSAFGPAPNNSYVINTNGVVSSKHGWFHKSPDNIFCDLDSILNVNKGLCNVSSTPGTFTIDVINDYVNGKPGDLLYDYADIINVSADPVTVKVKKLQKVLPASWQTAFCADVCYSTSDDSIQFTIPAYDTLLFSLDFFTDIVADSGRVRVGFRNAGKTNNSFSMWFRANTFEEPEVGILEQTHQALSLRCYPNPATHEVLILTDEKDYRLTLYNEMGEEVWHGENTSRLNTDKLKRGIYFLSLRSSDKVQTTKIILTD
jgi:hypothetical protein